MTEYSASHADDLGYLVNSLFGNTEGICNYLRVISPSFVFTIAPSLKPDLTFNFCRALSCLAFMKGLDMN